MKISSDEIVYLGSYKLSYPKIQINLFANRSLNSDADSFAILFGVHNCLFGEYIMASTSYGISMLQFIDGDKEAIIEGIKERGQHHWVARDDKFASIFSSILKGENESGTINICLNGTSFQQKVWEALITVPFGETETYSQLAERIGKPKAVRAVASAVASNDIAYLIPCHRIVHSDGSLGGYRWGGTGLKAKILEWERRKAKEPGIK